MGREMVIVDSLRLLRQPGNRLRVPLPRHNLCRLPAEVVPLPRHNLCLLPAEVLSLLPVAKEQGAM